MDLRYLIVPAVLALLALAGCPNDDPNKDPNNPGPALTVDEGAAAEGGE
jgi:hypothetical protein